MWNGNQQLAEYDVVGLGDTLMLYAEIKTNYSIDTVKKAVKQQRRMYKTNLVLPCEFWYVSNGVVFETTDLVVNDISPTKKNIKKCIPGGRYLV